MKNKIKKEIQNLRENLKKWNEEYYQNSAPSVNDTIFDNALVKLTKLEKEHPEFFDPKSPSIKVGGAISSSFKKAEHETPMLSLKNAFNYDDLYHFDKQIKNFTYKEVGYTLEPKIDGLSISIIYENGKLKQAITRGNGEIGEDVTENIKQISLPKQISIKNKLTLRGEVFFTDEQFDIINNERLKLGMPLFMNPRNAISGTMRQIDSSVVKKRKPKIFIYFALSTLGDFWDSQWKTLNELDKLGFPVNIKNSVYVKNINEAIEEIELIIEERPNLSYEIDGVVLKVNDNQLHKMIGFTSKFPKWAIAYKMSSEVKETKLLDIFPSVGRTGRITYNAKLKPVLLARTTVQRATLHNADYIKSLDLRVGSVVLVKKAGDIIPKVVGTTMNKDFSKEKKWSEPSLCPSCGSKLLRRDGEVDQYCINESCPSRLMESLIHFVSRDAMNIEGLSEKQIEKFINLNLIKLISDIYKLRREDLINLEGYQDKSIDNLLNSINKSKKNPLNQVLFSLGIRYIGKKTSLDLANSFLNIKNIKLASFDKLMNQANLGEVKSKSIVTFFTNEKNIKLIDELLNLGVEMSFQKKKTNISNRFSGKTIVITGTILGGTRDEIKDRLRQLGAKVTSSISGTTDFVITGLKGSEKKLSTIESSKIIRVENIDEIK